MFWTKEVTDAIREHNLQRYADRCTSDLMAVQSTLSNASCHFLAYVLFESFDRVDAHHSIKRMVFGLFGLAASFHCDI